MKTTYIYCKICKKVHEKAAPGVQALGACDPNDLSAVFQRMREEICKAFGLSPKFFKW